ncbi:MAG: hypothetical protein Q9227_006432 [Pyrenula ochraceoflavens]
MASNNATTPITTSSSFENPTTSSSIFQPPTDTTSSSSSFIPTTSSSSFITSSSSIPTLSSSVPLTTSVITITPSSSSGAPTSPVVVITSTQSPPTVTAPTPTTSPSSSSSSSTSSSAQPLGTGSNGSSSKSGGGGLGTGGTIAVAVVVPIAAIALIVWALIFFWKKRKQRKDAEELRRKEVEEYGFNPNNDPTLPAVGSGSNYAEGGSEMAEDNSGYRGWGNTSTQRKPSTNLGSSRAGIGMAVSDTASNPSGQGYQGSPSNGQHSDVHSGDPLVGTPNGGRPPTGDSETIGALGAAPAARRQENMHRGPSNASSAYSGPRGSDASDEGPSSPQQGGAPYYEEPHYYSDAQPNHGPYGDGSYGGGQPIIRDVQARRNTRIQQQSHFPQQGSSGIAQNF